MQDTVLKNLICIDLKKDEDLQWPQTFPAMHSTCFPSLFKKSMGPAHKHALSQLQQYRHKQEFLVHASNHSQNNRRLPSTNIANNNQSVWVYKTSLP